MVALCELEITSSSLIHDTSNPAVSYSVTSTVWKRASALKGRTMQKTLREVVSIAILAVGCSTISVPQLAAEERHGGSSNIGNHDRDRDHNRDHDRDRGRDRNEVRNHDKERHDKGEQQSDKGRADNDKNDNRQHDDAPGEK